MKVGIFMMPVHPPEKDRTECFEEDLELVVLADQLGYTEAWIGQHFSVPWEPIPSNDIFIANALPRTKSIIFGTGVTLIQYHHPVNAALRLAYLDHLSRGRLYCGFGRSGISTDLSLFDLPNDPATLGKMTTEGMDLVLKLWTTDPPFDFKSENWRIRLDEYIPEISKGIILKPYQKPHPPIAMSIVSPQSMAASTAGERGFIPISSNLCTGAVLAKHWETYCEGAQKANRPMPDRSMWRVARNIFVADSTEEALEHALNGSFAGSFDYLIRLIGPAGLNGWKIDPAMSSDEITPEYVVKTLAIVGDVEECIRQLQEVWDASGGFGTLLSIAHDWDDKTKWKHSMDLLKNKVLPALPSV